LQLSKTREETMLSISNENKGFVSKALIVGGTLCSGVGLFTVILGAGHTWALLNGLAALVTGSGVFIYGCTLQPTAEKTNEVSQKELKREKQDGETPKLLPPLKPGRGRELHSFIEG